MFPHVQAAAQNEIEIVVGNSRSPGWGDLDEHRLPYVSALAMDIRAWRIPTDMSCSTILDEIYRGYQIPGETTICNVWATKRNPREFVELGVSRPARVPGSQNGGLELRLSRSGQMLVDQSFLSVLARLLWAFNITPGLDETVSRQHQALKLFFPLCPHK